MLFQLAAGFGGGAGGHIFGEGGAQRRQVVKALAHGFGEFVVQVGQRLFLDGQHFHPKVHGLTGVLLAGVVVRDGNDELAFVILGEAQQVGGETGKRQDVFRLRHIFHVGIVNHGCVADGAAHIEVEAVAVLRRAFHRLPDGLLLADGFQRGVNLLGADFIRRDGYPDGAVIAQIHGGFQGDGGGKGHRLQIRNLNTGLAESAHLLVPQHPIQRFGHHIVQRLAEQGGAPDDALDHAAGRLAAPESGDVDLRHGAPIRALQVRVFVLRGHFNREFQFNGG